MHEALDWIPSTDDNIDDNDNNNNSNLIYFNEKSSSTYAQALEETLILTSDASHKSKRFKGDKSHLKPPILVSYILIYSKTHLISKY
jgi:hypothetical protein